MFTQNWETTCDANNRFPIYRTMKFTFGYDKYLSYINVAKFRFAYTRLRIAASYLHVNRKLIHRDANTKCPFCPQEENELHFLLFCKEYNLIRQKYIHKHFDNINISISQLLNNNKVCIILDVAIYAHKAFEIRSKKLREMKLKKRIALTKRHTAH